jgi:hypothetical protein
MMKFAPGRKPEELEIPEVANPSPDSDEVAYAKLAAFLAENGVNLPAAPRSNLIRQWTRRCARSSNPSLSSHRRTVKVLWP